jgi:hypothetical protein
MRTSITFTLRGITGRVRIEFEENTDPARWGFDLLGLDFDAQAARGFPVVTAKVEYPAEGYRGHLGWLQVVIYAVIRESERSTTEVVDVPPQLRDTTLPYLSFGIEPTLFDAPAITEPNVSWRARSFLVSTRDLLMTPNLDPVCGFAWGYEIQQGAIELVAPRACNKEDWSTATRVLRQRLPGWNFGGDDWQPVSFDSAVG